MNIRGGSNQWTPLFYAAQSGHDSVVELLLDIGADPQVGTDHRNVHTHTRTHVHTHTRAHTHTHTHTHILRDLVIV